ncbi:MAG: DUF1674 domain-containing protein [Pseudomonadota bacterium]
MPDSFRPDSQHGPTRQTGVEGDETVPASDAPVAGFATTPGLPTANVEADKSEDQIKQDDRDEPIEIGGRDGPEPTRFGDWEKNGRCIDV